MINFIVQVSDVDFVMFIFLVNNLLFGVIFIDFGNGNVQFEWMFIVSDVGLYQIIIIVIDVIDFVLISQIQIYILVEVFDLGIGGSVGMIFNELGGLVVMEGEYFSSVNVFYDDVNWNVINNNVVVENSVVQVLLIV